LVKAKGKSQYRRGGESVTNFPDTTTVKVVFSRGPAGLDACAILPPFDPARINFRVEWRDGQHAVLAKGKFVESREPRRETWCEDGCSGGQWIYELRVDSQGMPFADELVIRIEATDGTCLAEFVGKVTESDAPPANFQLIQATNLAPAP
jgi:hypothetical protein